MKRMQQMVLGTVLALGAGAAWADFVVGSDLTLTGDLEWQYRGKMTVADGVTVDLAGHRLSVGELAGGGTITNSVEGTPAELHVFVPHGYTWGNASVAIGGNLRLVKDGRGTFAPTKTGQTYTGGTEVADGILKAWSNHLPLENDDVVTIGPKGWLDIDGAAASFRNGSLGDGKWRVLAGGTLCNNAGNIGSGWSQLDHLRLTADSTISSAYSWGLIGISYGATDLDLAGHTATLSIAKDKCFYLWNTDVTAGTLKTISEGVLDIDKTGVRAAEATLDLGTPIKLTASATFGTVIARYTGSTASGNGALNIKDRFEPLSDYVNNFVLQDGATLDLRKRTGSYSFVCLGTTKTLACAQGATITVDIGGRVLEDNDPIVSWSLTPTDVTFVLDAESARAYDLVQTGTGLAVVRKANYPATAKWHGAGDVTNPKDPANWLCTDVAGEAIEGYPCVLTEIYLGAAETMNVPAGTTLYCKTLKSEESVAVLSADCDWRGLATPILKTSVDLNGHVLRVCDLAGNGTYVDNTLDAEAPGELHLDISAGEVVANSSGAVLSGNLRLVKDGAGTYAPTFEGQQAYTGGTRVAAGLMKSRASRYAVPLTVDAGARMDYDPYVGGGVWALSGGPFVMNGGDLYQEWADLSTGWGQISTMRLTADSSFSALYTGGFIGGGYGVTTLDLGGYTLDVDLSVAGGATKFFQLFNTTATKGTIRVGEATSVYFLKESFRGPETTLELDGLVEADVPVTVSNLVLRTISTAAWGNQGITVLGALTPVSDWLYVITLQSGATLDLNRRVDPFQLTSPLTGKTLGFQANASITVDVHDRACTNGMQLVSWAAPPSGISFALDPETTEKGAQLVSNNQGLYIFVSGDVATARWTGAIDNDFSKSGNWVCHDVKGREVPDGVPNEATIVSLPADYPFPSLTAASFPHCAVTVAGGTLTGDADWSGLGETLALEGVIDLAGHTLTVSSLQGDATVTDSTEDASAPGELHLVVPAGLTRGNSTVALTGNLKLVKEGEGTFTPTKTEQSYTGGTELAGGLTKAWTTHYSGANALTIDAGATLDIDGANAGGRTAYFEAGYTLNGGTIVNQTSDITWAVLPLVRLTADSTLLAKQSFQMLGNAYGPTSLLLNGNTLTVDIAANESFSFCNTDISAGTLKSVGAGTLLFTRTAPRMNGTSLDLGTALTLDKNIALKLQDLTVRYTGTAGSATLPIEVTGVYTPVTDFLLGFKLLNGATIDLREKTGAWNLTNSANRSLAIAPEAQIQLNLAGRTDLEDGTQVLAFGSAAVDAKVKFRLDPTTAGRFYAVRDANGVTLKKKSCCIIIR